MKLFEMNFDKPFFDDLPPEPKSSEELTGLILQEASGQKVDMSKYNDREINRAVRKLIMNGLLRGTVIDEQFCSWSKLTPKGEYYLHLESKELFY